MVCYVQIPAHVGGMGIYLPVGNGSFSCALCPIIDKAPNRRNGDLSSAHKGG